MDRDPFGEQVVCWICDYGLFGIALLAVLVVGLLRWNPLGGGISLPPGVSLPEGIELPFIVTDTPTPTATHTPTPTATATITPTATQPPTLTPTTAATATPLPPSQPAFIIVYLPIAWSSGQEAYSLAAQRQAQAFLDESDMQDYFEVQVVVLDAGPANADLTSGDLVSTVVEYGLAAAPGDRYIGLTDGDIVLDGVSDVVGWTEGGLGMVLEADDPYVSAHELGHTFGLCDEYSYYFWTLQNQETRAGCPNPFPSNCPLDLTAGVSCSGAPTRDGRNSIMGPSGLVGEYGFNDPCYAHLTSVFQTYLQQAEP